MGVGEGRGFAHLTLPIASTMGPLPLSPMGGEGIIDRAERSGMWLSRGSIRENVEADLLPTRSSERVTRPHPNPPPSRGREWKGGGGRDRGCQWDRELICSGPGLDGKGGEDMPLRRRGRDRWCRPVREILARWCGRGFGSVRAMFDPGRHGRRGRAAARVLPPPGEGPDRARAARRRRPDRRDRDGSGKLSPHPADRLRPMALDRLGEIASTWSRRSDPLAEPASEGPGARGSA